MPRSPAASLGVPRVAVVLLVASNAAAYLMCFRVGGAPAVPLPVLVAAGALTPAALQPGEAWRLLAAGFLHADPVHLLSNLLALAIVGPFLERRLGFTGFTLVYAASLVGAGIASVLLHHDAFIGVGASGAIFGLLGALLALWGLGDAEIAPSFLLVNFALNAALASRDPRIDWAAHAGGLLAGMAAIAMLDAISRVNAHWLRCKFPEFVRADTAMLAAAGCAALLSSPPAVAVGLDSRLTALSFAILAALGFIKLLDLALWKRRGLAVAVLMLAAGNAAAAWWAGGSPCRRSPARAARPARSALSMVRQRRSV